MFFTPIEGKPCDNYFRYTNFMSGEYEKIKLLATENFEITYSTRFGTLSEFLTTNDHYYEEFFDTLKRSNEECWEYDIHQISNVYILDTNLNFEIKHQPEKEKIFFTWYYNVSSVIKIVAVIELDEGEITLNNGSLLTLDMNETIYTFPSITLCKFDRNKRYLIYFGLGKKFR